MDTDWYLDLRYQDRGRGPGYDCWGLVWLAYQKELAVTLPSYCDDYPNSNAGQSIQAVIDDQIRQWRPVDAAALYDLVIIRICGKRMHCGLALNAREFIHCLGTAGVSIESFSDRRWEKRISGIYRHASRIRMPGKPEM